MVPAKTMGRGEPIAAEVTQQQMDQAQIWLEDASISTDADGNYRFLMQNGRMIRLTQAELAVVLAADGHTIEEFEQMSDQNKVRTLISAARETRQMAYGADELTG